MGRKTREELYVYVLHFRPLKETYMTTAEVVENVLGVGEVLV